MKKREVTFMGMPVVVESWLGFWLKRIQFWKWGYYKGFLYRKPKKEGR